MSTPGLLHSDRPLTQAYDLAVLDLDGVVYVGPDAVPGAGSAVEAARADGMRVCFLTNNASRTPDTVSEHLTSLGVPATVDEVVTSAQVAARLLAARLPAGAPVLVIGGDGLTSALTACGLRPVASMDAEPVAVVQGFNPELGWRQLAEGARAVRAGLLWVASNLDLTVPTVHGPAPGNGSLVAAVAAAGGRRPDLVAGKPQPEPFHDAAARYDARRPIVVGDRLDTDIEGANAAGFDAMAVLTGVSRVADLVAAAPQRRPQYLAVDLAGLGQPHPQVTLEHTDAAVRATCAAARVEVAPPTAGGQPTPDAEVRVLAVGEPIDLLRAGCAAAWAWADQGGGPVASTDLERVCREVGGTGPWSR